MDTRAYVGHLITEEALWHEKQWQDDRPRMELFIRPRCERLRSRADTKGYSRAMGRRLCEVERFAWPFVEHELSQGGTKEENHTADQSDRQRK